MILTDGTGELAKRRSKVIGEKNEVLLLLLHGRLMINTWTRALHTRRGLLASVGHKTIDIQSLQSVE